MREGHLGAGRASVSLVEKGGVGCIACARTIGPILCEAYNELGVCRLAEFVHIPEEDLTRHGWL